MGALGDKLADELRYVLHAARHDVHCQMTIVMVHERDPEAGGCEFDRFIACTPKDLVQSWGLYKAIATGLYPGAHEDVSLAEVLKSLDLAPVKKTRRQKKSAAQPDSNDTA